MLVIHRWFISIVVCNFIYQKKQVDTIFFSFLRMDERGLLHVQWGIYYFFASKLFKKHKKMMKERSANVAHP